MTKVKRKTSQQRRQSSVIKYDSVKLWRSKNGALFVQVRIGSNSLFISEGLINFLKKSAA